MMKTNNEILLYLLTSSHAMPSRNHRILYLVYTLKFILLKIYDVYHMSQDVALSLIDYFLSFSLALYVFHVQCALCTPGVFAIRFHFQLFKFFAFARG